MKNLLLKDGEQHQLFLSFEPVHPLEFPQYQWLTGLVPYSLLFVFFRFEIFPLVEAEESK